MSYDLLVNWLQLEPDRLAVTIFEGDEDAPKDEEAAKVWKSLGIKEENIYYLGKKHNWWGPAGQTGPYGPDTEIFYNSLKPKCSENCNPACDCGKYWEICGGPHISNTTDLGHFKIVKEESVASGVRRIKAVVTGRE